MDFNGDIVLPYEKVDKRYTYFDSSKNVVSEDGAFYEEGYYAVDSSGNLIEPYTKVDSGFSYFDADGNAVSQAEALGSDTENIRLISEYGTDIYPKYAERNVILGLETLDGIPKEQTQIVMTMKEVLENIVDPYESSALPPNVNEIYDMLKSDRDNNTVHSAAEAKTKATKNGKKVVTGISSSGGVVSITTDDDVAGSPYINKSCILDWSAASSDFKGGNQIVIDPAGGILLVVIKNFSLENGYGIVIDDSEGGSVYFYIEENSKMLINGNGGIITTSYKGIFDNKTSFQVYTKDEYKLKDGTPTIQDLKCGNPKVYIYGGANSTLEMPNFTYMTFNILSPNITVSASGGNGALGDVDIYYNGRKMQGGNYMFGCCNSNTTTFPNQMNVVYIPSGSSDPPEVGTPDLSHWFKVLYYDEY